MFVPGEKRTRPPVDGPQPYARVKKEPACLPQVQVYPAYEPILDRLRRYAADSDGRVIECSNVAKEAISALGQQSDSWGFHVGEDSKLLLFLKTAPDTVHQMDAKIEAAITGRVGEMITLLSPEKSPWPHMGNLNPEGFNGMIIQQCIYTPYATAVWKIEAAPAKSE